MVFFGFLKFFWVGRNLNIKLNFIKKITNSKSTYVKRKLNINRISYKKKALPILISKALFFNSFRESPNLRYYETNKLYLLFFCFFFTFSFSCPFCFYRFFIFHRNCFCFSFFIHQVFIFMRY